MSGRFSLNNILFWGLLVVVCCSFWFIFWIYPPTHDDLEVVSSIKNNGAWQFVHYSVTHDNSRFGNLLSFVLISGPEWMMKFLEILAVPFVLFSLIRFADVKRSWMRLTLCIALFIFAPMWEDSMFCNSYLFNYFLPIPLLFAAIYVYGNPDRFPRWLNFLICFLAGCWHEAIAFMLLGGWSTMWLFDRKTYNGKNRFLPLAVILGLACLLAPPGLWARNDFYPLQLQNVLRLIFDWMYFLYAAVWLVCFAIRKSRHIALQPFHVFALGGFIFIPFVIKTALERAGMFSIIVSGCALASLLPQAVALLRPSKPLGIIKISLASLVYLFTVLHLIAVDRETSIIAPMFKQLCREYREAPAGQHYVFTPVRYAWDAPWITLRRPHWVLFTPDDWSLLFVKSWSDRFDIMAVPSELREYRSGMGEQIGNRGLRIWKTHIVSDNMADTSAVASFVSYPIGKKHLWAPVAKTVFPGADGRDHVYIVPKRSALSTYFGTPVDIELIYGEEYE